MAGTSLAGAKASAGRLAPVVGRVKISAYGKYYNPQGTQSNLSGFALALTGAFGVSSGSTGEALKAYNSLNNYGGMVASGGGAGSSSYPKLFVNILLFDKDHNFLEAAWQQIDGGEQVGASSKAAHDSIAQEVTVKEAGYAYVYVSNENPTSVEFYVDDVTVTYTPSNVIQYNEYYPFGLQTASSWTRENSTANNFLYNDGNELNKDNGWYEMFYRGYDPALGRMLQVDPYASSFASQTPYNYALNSPTMINDPSGGMAYNGSDALRDRIGRLASQGWSVDLTPGSWDWGETVGSGAMHSQNNDVFGYHHEDLYGRTNSAMVQEMLYQSNLSSLSPGAKADFIRQNGVSLTGYMTYSVKDGKLFGDIYITFDDPETSAYILGRSNEDYPGGKLFTDVKKGLSDIWEKSFRNGRAYKENLAYFTPRGLLVMPNKDNDRHHSSHGLFREKDGKLFVLWNDGSGEMVPLEILAIIHTHPNIGDKQEHTPGVDFTGGRLGIHNYVMAHFGLYDGVLGPDDVIKLGPREDYDNQPDNLFVNKSD